jgi:hypothetical protein
MIKVYKKILSMVLLVGALQTAVAQNQEDISAFLSAGGKDASKLIEAYLQPTVTSLSYGMTGGWYNTAATHKTLGIDFGISANVALIPSSEDFFNPNKLGLSVTTYEGARNNGSGVPYDPTRKAPTFFGSKDETSYSATYDPDGAQGPLGPQTVSFSGPEGLGVKDELGVSGVPVPVIQLGVGIIKNTDLKFRFIPKVDAGSSEISMFGVGIQHDIKQHIKGIKLLPFDLSVLVAYNSLKGETDLRNDNTGDTRPDSQDGMGVYKFNSWVYQLLISKKLSVLTIYGGIGYSMINTKVNMNGTYEIDASPSTFSITDPVSISIKNKSMRFTAGMRLKLGPIYLVGDYTLQKYKMFNLGLGFSIRENKHGVL